MKSKQITLTEGRLRRIHVNQHHIKANAKDGGSRPVFTIKGSRINTKAEAVEIHGESRMVYQPGKPLSCGAKVWMETRAAITATVANEE